MYLHSADRWWWSSVAMYHQQTNQSQQAIEQTKFIQKVVSPDVSKPNHAVMNKKQDKKQFSLEKKWIRHSCQPIISVDGLWYKIE